MVALLTATCVLTYLLIQKPLEPVSVAFHGYTNTLVGTAAAKVLGEDAEAVFLLKNRSTLDLRCRFTLDAFRRGSTRSESSSAGELVLPASGVRTVSVMTPETTNGWRFEMIVSASGSPPMWQRRMTTLLGRVGLQPVFLMKDRIYPIQTNSWSNL